MANFAPLSYQDTITTLNLIKIDKHTTEPLIIKWIHHILKPPTSIISSILKEIFSPKSTNKTIESNFALIRKLLVICYNDTSKRLRHSNGLSCDIMNYIAYTAKSVLCQDSLTILNEVFNVDEVKGYLTEKFVLTIFDLLNGINDEENFIAAICILISVNGIFKPCDDNYFLKVYHFHSNSRFFDEAILRLLNNETKPFRIKEIIDCIVLIIDCEQRIVFYSSDLEVFIDIALRQLQMCSYYEELKYKFIDAFEKIVGFEEYYKTMYKADEMIDLIEDCLDSENQTGRIKRKCRRIIKIINRHLYNKEKDNEEIINGSYNGDDTDNSNIELSFDNEEDDGEGNSNSSNRNSDLITMKDVDL